MEGCVYIIDYGDGEIFKVGRTTLDLEERLRAISRTSVKMPHKYTMSMVMSCYTENCNALEKLLHARLENQIDFPLRRNDKGGEGFRTKHAGGEWFYLNFVDLVELYQAFAVLGSPEVYDKWYELVPDDYQKYIDHGALSSKYPPFDQKKQQELYADSAQIFD